MISLDSVESGSTDSTGFSAVRVPSSWGVNLPEFQAGRGGEPSRLRPMAAGVLGGDADGGATRWHAPRCSRCQGVETPVGRGASEAYNTSAAAPLRWRAACRNH